jgi:peptidyl-dipeptidase Dcp
MLNIKNHAKMKLKFVLILTIVSMTQFRIYAQDNPLMKPFNTPYGVPPFDLIKEEHFLPAIKEAIALQQQRVDEIVKNQFKPTFYNTIEALELSGVELDRVNAVFFNLSSANTNPQIQAIAKESAPLQAAHSDNISLNPRLFKKIKAVYESSERKMLSSEQNRLIDETYKRFVRNGAALDDSKKESLREINQKLSIFSLQFGDNVLAETNNYKLIIEDEKDLAGLPEDLIKAAASTANDAGMQGKWIFTLHNSSIMPFLHNADNRKLRAEIFQAYLNRGNNNNSNNNQQIIKEVVQLRSKKAQLLGYETHASYVLENNMAKDPSQVYNLLEQLWEAAYPVLINEANDLQSMINESGADHQLEPWDWRYYTEKLRKERYDFDDAELRPYFELNASRDAMFDVIEQLWGLKFKRLIDMPVYHPDVEVFEVTESNGTHVGILYADYHPRASKRGGAWMSSYRKQEIQNGENIRPVITIVCNFTKPVGDKPSLLSIEELTTLYHEMGHALHGLLSNVQYRSLSGTSVSRDFVELPSQILENWATKDELLLKYAKHYRTGESISTELLEKLKASQFFNMGFITSEYLAASFLDLAYHTISDSSLMVEPANVENETAQMLKLPDYVPYRYRSTYFNHIFSGGYSSGYYSYIWSEVLDADAFDSFEQHGLFDAQTASSFRKNILEKGGTEDPMELYKRFKGKSPDINPLLLRRGLVGP